MSLEQIALLGGLYVPLVFWHFVVDWLTQTEKMAEAKSENVVVLLLHCTIYTVLFVPILWLYDLGTEQVFLAGFALFTSHVVGDTYVPVWFWVRYIRRMTYQPGGSGDRARILHPEDIFRVGQQLDTSFYFKPSLVLVIDQLWHLAFLWVIPILALEGRG
jgi:hypothetical protein